MVWDRQRHLLRLRGALREFFREFFPAALAAFDDLAAPEALEVLAAAPDPAAAAGLSRASRARIRGALTRARRRDPGRRAEQVQAALRAEHLRQPPVVAGAYAVMVRSLTAAARGHRRPQRPDRQHGSRGGGPFWAAPGR
jgi:hypothetical protein